jgi:small subunit ribosomal protein S21
MAIRIKSRGGESVEQMLRRFKKLCEKEGLTKDVKRRQYFEKPSERRRRDARRSFGRNVLRPLTEKAERSGEKGERGSGGRGPGGRGPGGRGSGGRGPGKRGPGFGGSGGPRGD